MAKLLAAFRKLIEGGGSLLVIEHNLDVIKSADWVIDMGPEGGDGGGKVVAVGTPEEIAANPASHTGHWLAPVLAATCRIEEHYSVARLSLMNMLFRSFRLSCRFCLVVSRFPARAGLQQRESEQDHAFAGNATNPDYEQANAALEAHDYDRAVKLLAPLAAVESQGRERSLYDLGSAQDALDQTSPAEQFLPGGDRGRMRRCWSRGSRWG